MRKTTSHAATSTIAAPTGTVNTILAANVNRKRAFIQNVGTVPVKIKQGAACAADDFSCVLGAGSAQDDGYGGVLTLEHYCGILTAITDSGTGRLVVCEEE